jgi:REase_DpnII-MboI
MMANGPRGRTAMTDKRQKLESYLASANALLRSMELAPTSNPADVWRFTSYKQYIRKYNQLVEAVSAVETIDVPIDRYDEAKVPGIGDTIAIQQTELFQSVHANLSVLRAWLEQKVGKSAHEASSLGTFLQSRLRSAIFSLPASELEVQNAVEQLLIGRGLQKGIDYDRETGRVKISVKESIPDFIFRPLSLALEIKLSKDRSRHGKLVDEINADIAVYATSYQSIIFLVYDLGTIRDEIEFRQGLEATGNISVLVVKH